MMYDGRRRDQVEDEDEDGNIGLNVVGRDGIVFLGLGTKKTRQGGRSKGEGRIARIT